MTHRQPLTLHEPTVHNMCEEWLLHQLWAGQQDNWSSKSKCMTKVHKFTLTVSADAACVHSGKCVCESVVFSDLQTGGVGTSDGCRVQSANKLIEKKEQVHWSVCCRVRPGDLGHHF